MSLSAQDIANIRASLTPEQDAAILAKPFAQMVTELAKPGEDIVTTMTFSKFLQLLQIGTKIVDSGNDLDGIKRQVIYNKPVEHGTTRISLPSSAGLGRALDNLTADKAHLLHMAVGLAGEAAEMLDAVLAHVLGDPLDIDNIIEEGGDASFYIVGLLNGIGVPLDQALTNNKFKLLGARYASGKYSDEQAIARADKAEGQ